ncbi:UDP-glucuronosyltransferase 2C1-like isoform X1 [Branchiostoma lanceolatum]|uniref:UDP-glucuronosyltransferase 2C1-like isoform X1 n=1 Tax=Branchiostoma lanceolatum TaxID=7740 RepID=UPI003453B69D
MLTGSMFRYYFLQSLAISLLGHRCSGGNVLLVPMPFFDSHWFGLAKIGQALVKRGHVVTAVVPVDILKKRQAERPDFHFETFEDNGTGARLKEVQEMYFSVAKTMSVYESFRLALSCTEDITNHCDMLVGDKDLINRLKVSQYGVVIFDPIFPCGAIVAALIDTRVPLIAILRGDLYFLGEKATGVPLPPSYVPFLTCDFTDQMTFVQRIQNVLLWTLAPTMTTWLGSKTYDGLVRKYISERDTIQSVVSRTDLWLHRTDNVLDFPRPFMPNMVQIGGVNVQAVASLPKELESFVQSSSTDGVIVVSFGSMYRTLSPEKSEIFAAAFARLRQKVVWRYVGEKPTGLGNNTKVMNWLPQNDLLGHRKTRAFVTHAGYNGLCEAMYHGVPVVCLPLYGDQPANAARVVARGLGVKLDFSTVTADQLYQAVIHVLTNNSFQETAARLSRLHRDQPQPPMERAVWWIEHVIKHGGLSHLRARAVDLPWYQYYLLDVAAFLLAVCTAVMGAMLCSCSFMYGVFWHFCRIFSAKIK